MLKVHQLVFNPFEENTYIVTDTETGEGAVIDPGMFTDSDRLQFDEYIQANDIRLTQIINTHLHVDHCMGTAHVRDRYGVKVKASPADSALGERVVEQAIFFGLGSAQKILKAVTIDQELKDGDIISIGKGQLQVITTPGHSPGGIALYDAQDGFVITGDSLFRGSIGRTVLPGGNHRQLVESVRKKLLTLPSSTLIYPGHGPMSTVSLELATNPFVR